MLVVSAAAYTGHLPLSDNFAWLATPAALILLSVAAIVEILAYYIPGLDNLLDALATPAAFIAGTIISAAVFTDLPPMVKWAAAIIAGGGIAGLTQTTTTVLRAKSTLLTGTLGNPVIATAEFGGSLLVSLMALAAPLFTLLVIVRAAVAGDPLAPPASRADRSRREPQPLEAHRHRPCAAPCSGADRRSAGGDRRDEAWLLLALTAGEAGHNSGS